MIGSWVAGGFKLNQNMRLDLAGRWQTYLETVEVIWPALVDCWTAALPQTSQRADERHCDGSRMLWRDKAGSCIIYIHSVQRIRDSLG